MTAYVRVLRWSNTAGNGTYLIPKAVQRQNLSGSSEFGISNEELVGLGCVGQLNVTRVRLRNERINLACG